MATTKTTAKKPASASAAKTTASAKSAAAAKPAVKKPAAAKVPAQKTAAAAAKKPAAKRSAAAKMTVTPEQRYCMVAEAAYYRAERQGFLGDPVQDWIDAEAEIAALLGGGK